MNYIDAFEVVSSSKDVIKSAIESCEFSSSGLLEGVAKLYPLLDIDTARSAITLATLHNPYSFSENLIKASKLFSEGEPKSSGKIIG